MSPLRLFLFLFLCLSLTAFPQFFKQRQALIDRLSVAKKDTQKVSILIELSQLTQNQNFIESYNYAKQAADISEKINYTIGRIRAYNALGDASWFHVDYSKAQDFYFKAYKLNDSLKDQVEIANSLYNIGWVTCIQQHNFKDISYLYRSLSIFETQKNVKGIVKGYNALGGFYAERFVTSGTKSYFDSASVYLNKAVAACSASPELSRRRAVFYGNIGNLLAMAGDYKSAVFYCEKAIKTFDNDGDSAVYYGNITSLGSYYSHLGEVDRSVDLLQSALRFCRRNDNRELLILVYKELYEAFVKKNNAPLALENLEKYTSLNDTINRQIFSTNLKDRQNSFEIEKKEADIRQLRQTNEIHQLQEEKNMFFLIATVCIALIVLSVAYFLYKQNKEKSVANKRLSEQNAIITQKKQEIDKSINYAKGIQNAVLPDLSELKKYYPESFIFYLPKDVVSGDFYWFSGVESSGFRDESIAHGTTSQPSTLNSQLILAAADCTGHGVPGALMSIVSMDKLNQAVFEKKLGRPAEILQFLNVEIKKALKQHSDESKQKDGLDIALLRLDPAGTTLYFAGANRPLYLVRNGSLTEYRSDKVAIAGFTPNDHVFSEQQIALQKNDCIYIFSDGYADQFGSESGKKFMTRNLKALLESMYDKDLKEQERLVIESHRQWKGSYEQVDDILVIGIRI